MTTLTRGISGSGARREALVEVEEGTHHLLFSVLIGKPAALLRERSRKGRLGEHAPHCARQSRRIARLHQQPGAPIHEQLAHAPGGRRDDGSAGGKRLECHERQALPPGRQHEHVRGAHERPGVLSQPQERDAIGEPALRCQPLEVAAQLPVSDDGEMNTRQESERLQRERVVLLVDEPADGDRERCVHGDPPLPLQDTAIGGRRRRAHRVQDRGRRLEAVLRERGGYPGPAGDDGQAGEPEDPGRGPVVVVGNSVEAGERGGFAAAYRRAAGDERHAGVVGMDDVGPAAADGPAEREHAGRNATEAALEHRQRERLRSGSGRQRPAGGGDEHLVAGGARAGRQHEQRPLRTSGAKLLDHLQDPHALLSAGRSARRAPRRAPASDAPSPTGRTRQAPSERRRARTRPAEQDRRSAS